MKNQDHYKAYDYAFYIRSIGMGIRYLNDQKLFEYQITNQQGRLLDIIFREWQAGREVNRNSLQEIVQLRGPSITSLLNSLEKKDFITRSAESNDGRKKSISVTRKGLRLISEMETVFRDTEDQLLTGMTDAEKDQFLELLKKANRNIGGKP